MRNLICQICKTSFNCNVNEPENCWCTKLPVKIIDKDLTDCICSNCLSKKENKKLAKS